MVTWYMIVIMVKYQKRKVYRYCKESQLPPLTFTLYWHVCLYVQGCKVGVVWGGRVSVHVLEEREAQSQVSL